MAFEDITLIDNHAHTMLPPETAAAESFARYFTEGHDVETVARFTPETLFFRHAVRELAELLGCEPTAEAVVAERAVRPFDEYLRTLLREANVGGLLLDDGYPRRGAL